ncbi:hypothetical protein NDU88_013249 [Pleurodeles waltl]|uniref:Uncharacterized protein n=1 Tax=Pleurodeles waltl TaxID=8319 RepID=A0AAV7R868_PLEWA|nr:hypothetical protein NDU88_013249 [Pleurodeles waltl]
MQWSAVTGNGCHYYAMVGSGRERLPVLRNGQQYYGMAASTRQWSAVAGNGCQYYAMVGSSRERLLVLRTGWQ